MATNPTVEPDHESTDPLCRLVDQVLSRLSGSVVDATEVSDAVRLDRIAMLEQLRAVTAKLQAAECAREG